jgi:hypothetical protein
MAGNAYSGKNMYLGLGIQTAKGTPAAAFAYFQPIDISGVLPEYEFKKSEKRVGTRFAALGRKSTKKIPFGFTIECTPKNLGYLLYAICGAESFTETVTGEVGTHVFTFAEVLPYITIRVYSAGVADASGSSKIHQILDCKVSSAKFSGGVDGDVMKLAIEGEGLSRSAEAVPGTITYDETDPFILHSDESAGILKIGSSLVTAAQFEEALEFAFDITNGISADRRINGSGTPSGIREADSSLTGKAKVVYNNISWPEIEAYNSGSERAISLEVKHAMKFHTEGSTDYFYTLKFEFDRTKYSGSTPSFDADVISVELPFDIARTDSLKITLVNDRVEDYNPAA